MNRVYNLNKTLKYIDLIKKISPETFIFTHIIVGFPGETSKDFRKTLSILHKYHAIYTFCYSRRKGSKAYNLPDNVAEIRKKTREKIVFIFYILNLGYMMLKNIIKRNNNHS